jgi:DNA-binding NarL/FixJ family response regulator
VRKCSASNSREERALPDYLDKVDVTRILIADDSPAVRRALVQRLNAALSSELIVVENGQAALSRALELRPALVILDLAMPIMDGLTAAREISSALPEVPILMYTMHCTPSLAMAAQRFGVRHVVAKENPAELLAAVEQLLPAEVREQSAAREQAHLEPKVVPPVVVPDAEIIEAENGAGGNVPASDLGANKAPVEN